mgnify:CR=1 FL=1
MPAGSRRIVHTVGAEAAEIFVAHQKLWKARGKGDNDRTVELFEGADMSKRQWIGADRKLTDEEGFFTNLDGTRSAVVHQYDRYGRRFAQSWLAQFARTLPEIPR